MKILYYVIFFYILCNDVMADRPHIDFRCDGNTIKCNDLKRKSYKVFETLRKKKNIIDYLKQVPVDNSVLSFSYELEVIRGDVKKIEIILLTKSRIREVKYKINDDVDISYLSKNIRKKVGKYFDDQTVDLVKKETVKFFADSGIPLEKINLSQNELDNDEIDIVVNIEIKKIKISKIILSSDNSNLLEKYALRFDKFEKKIYNPIQFQIEIDDATKGLQKKGFLTGQMILKKVEKMDDLNVVIHCYVKFGKQLNFMFRGNKIIDRGGLIDGLRKKILQNPDSSIEKLISRELKAMYEARGIYNNHFEVKSMEGIRKNNSYFKNYYVEIKEGKKVRVDNLKFHGVLKRSLEEILELYDEKSSTLAKSNYLDKGFLENFSNILKENYLSKGFIFAEVSRPIIEIKGEIANVYFDIKEKNLCIVRKINISGLGEDLKIKAKLELNNIEGEALNITRVREDMSKILKIIKEEGYLFARIGNIKDKNVVNYLRNYTVADLNIMVTKGKKAHLGRINIVGNKRTRPEVIEREIDIEKNGVLTPSLLKNISMRLNALGLFSSVLVRPVLDDGTYDKKKPFAVDLLVKVKERESGSFEIAPGYRTDLGAKLSFFIIRNNISGLNQSLSYKIQTNYRFNSSGLDLRRKTADNKMLEFFSTLKFSRPYIFNFLDFSVSSTYQRKRFFSFDANIFRVSPQISKKLTKYFSMSLKYSFEAIGQFDATRKKDNDKFQTGGLTPSFSLDFRDDPINTRKGALFGLSWEFVNPGLYSFSNEEKEVNFSKLVSRNKFYYPVGNFVLAFSLAGGFQQNYSRKALVNSDGTPKYNDDGTLMTHGYIPSIKVFRLDGPDVVRGFADSEINRLPDGRDISDLRIQNKVYFTVLKFEPRYYLDDSSILSLFFDAGHMFVDKFRPLKLRASSGLSFKYLTKVGSLDFDYGIKLKRKNFKLGESKLGKEGFGRFHISIGFF